MKKGYGKFPKELMEIIMLHVDYVTLVNMSFVSKSVNRLFKKIVVPTRKFQLDYFTDEHIWEKELNQLQGLSPYIKKLTINGFPPKKVLIELPKIPDFLEKLVSKCHFLVKMNF